MKTPYLAGILYGLHRAVSWSIFEFCEIISPGIKLKSRTGARKGLNKPTAYLSSLF
jgi:hypothetical protein